MVYGSEKPTTRRTRIAIMAAVWLVVGIPLIIGGWLLMSWWTLLPLAVLAWASVDYIRKGGSGIDHYSAGWLQVQRASRSYEARPGPRR